MSEINPYQPPAKVTKTKTTHDVGRAVWSWWNVRFHTESETEGDLQELVDHLRGHYQSTSARINECEQPFHLNISRGNWVGTLLGPEHWARHRIQIHIESVNESHHRIHWQVDLNLFCGLLFGENRIIRECESIVHGFAMR